MSIPPNSAESASDSTLCAMCGAELSAGTRVCLNCGERLPVVQNRKLWPMWVRFGLWRIHSRKWARRWVWVSLGLGVFFLILALLYAALLQIWVFASLGVFIFVCGSGAAAWYHYSIQWVDQNDSWTKP